MTYVIDSFARPSISVNESELRFAVSRVFGIGRNYSDKPDTEEKNDSNVVLFMKDPFMLSPANEGIYYPRDTSQLRYEIELVVAIGRSGKNIKVAEANDYIFGYGVGIDFTKYDMQDVAKKNGWPWDRGKSFYGCAPCSNLTLREKFKPQNNKIWLSKNDVEVQNGTLHQMIRNVAEIISLLSNEFGLLAGDLIFTGTPNGIGMTQKGDILIGGVDGLETIQVPIK